MLFGIGVLCCKSYCLSVVYYSIVKFSRLTTLGVEERADLIFLLSITRNFVVLVRRNSIFLWVLRIGCDVLLWHSVKLTL